MNEGADAYRFPVPPARTAPIEEIVDSQIMSAPPSPRPAHHGISATIYPTRFGHRIRLTSGMGHAGSVWKFGSHERAVRWAQRWCDQERARKDHFFAAERIEPSEITQETETP
jgi:hypothetical protein